MNTIKSLSTSIYFYCWLLLAACIPLSKFATSLFFILLLILWLLSGNWRNLAIWKENSFNLLISTSTFLLFVVGLWNTTNFAYAIKDLNSKLPLLVLPVVALTGPKVTNKEFRLVLIFLVLGGVTSALIGFIRYQFFLPGQHLDFRNLSPFISHIRLSLVLCFAVGLIYHSLTTVSSKWKWILVFPLLFILYFLNRVQSLTSVVVLLVLALYTFIFATNWKEKRWIRISALSCFVAVVFFFAAKFTTIYQLTFSEEQIPEQPELYTLNGNPYTHFFEDHSTENGHLVNWYICEEELRNEWNKRSEIGIDSIVRGYILKTTLVRYLSSKGLRKDSVGISKLSTEDVVAIEKGVSNFYYVEHGGIDARLHKALWELKRNREGQSPYNNSIAMRFFFWENALDIIQRHFWWGIGTGDVQDEIKKQYEKSEFDNYPKIWRTHNQFLTVMISGGIFGLLSFLFTWFLLYRKVPSSNYLYHAGYLLIFISMLWEDTLETQAGSSIVALLVLVPFALFQRNKQEALKS